MCLERTSQPKPSGLGAQEPGLTNPGRAGVLLDEPVQGSLGYPIIAQLELRPAQPVQDQRRNRAVRRSRHRLIAFAMAAYLAARAGWR